MIIILTLIIVKFIMIVRIIIVNSSIQGNHYSEFCDSCDRCESVGRGDISERVCGEHCDLFSTALSGLVWQRDAAKRLSRLQERDVDQLDREASR